MRRDALWLGWLLLALLLGGCEQAAKPVFRGSDISGSNFGLRLALTDHNGRAVTLETFRGKVQAAAEVADRVEGRVMERVQVDHRGDPLAELLSEFKREYDEIPKADAPDANS